MKEKQENNSFYPDLTRPFTEMTGDHICMLTSDYLDIIEESREDDPDSPPPVPDGLYKEMESFSEHRVLFDPDFLIRIFEHPHTGEILISSKIFPYQGLCFAGEDIDFDAFEPASKTEDAIDMSCDLCSDFDTINTVLSRFDIRNISYEILQHSLITGFFMPDSAGGFDPDLIIKYHTRQFIPSMLKEIEQAWEERAAEFGLEEADKWYPVRETPEEWMNRHYTAPKKIARDGTVRLTIYPDGSFSPRSICLPAATYREIARGIPLEGIPGETRLNWSFNGIEPGEIRILNRAARKRPEIYHAIPAPGRMILEYFPPETGILDTEFGFKEENDPAPFPMLTDGDHPVFVTSAARKE